MDPVESGMWHSLFMPVYIIDTMWDIITDTDQVMAARFSLFAYMILIQYIIT